MSKKMQWTPSIYKRPATAISPPAIAPIAGSAVGTAAPVEPVCAAPVKLARIELSLASKLLRTDAARELAAAPPDAVIEAKLDAPSERRELMSPATELAKEARSDRLAMELRSPASEFTREEAPPAMEETSPRSEERSWPLAAPAPRTVTMMVVKRMVMCDVVEELSELGGMLVQS